MVNLDKVLGELTSPLFRDAIPSPLSRKVGVVRKVSNYNKSYYLWNKERALARYYADHERNREKARLLYWKKKRKGKVD